MDRQLINTGVNLTNINTEKFSTSTISLTFIKPISSINPSLMAVLPYVLIAGCEKFENFEKINKKLNSLYGSKIEPIVRKKGEFLCISFVCDIINQEFADRTNLLKEIYNLLLEIVLNPLLENGVFKESIVNSEKENLITRINSIKNDKRVYANTRMFEIMCKNEPYGLSRFGTVEDASKITPHTLYNAYNEIISTSQVEIFYCGNEDISSFSFDMFPSRDAIIMPDAPQFSSLNVHEVVETMDISQGKLSMGFRTNVTAKDSDYPALAMFNTIFGGSTNSKLFVNVRENMSLCYYASSNIDKLKGVLSVNSGIEIGNFIIAKEAILKQFYDIQNGEFSVEDINSAKLTLINNLKTAKDSLYSLEDFYLTTLLCKDSSDIEKLIFEVEKVSKQQIIDVSKKILLDTIYFLKGDEQNG